MKPGMAIAALITKGKCMPSGQELAQAPLHGTFMLNGSFGSGKTRQGLTAKKTFGIGFDPNGFDVVKQKELARLANNLVWFEYINPTTDGELRDAFREEKNKEGKRGALYELFDRVKDMAAKGEVENLLLDGVTYLVDLRWKLINIDEIEKSANTGNVDTQAMYRNLGLKLQTFFARDLLPMAGRCGISIVCTCHLKRESEETLEGAKDARTGLKKAGKVNKLNSIAPQIEGGFRNKVEGLFGASIYLERKLDGGKTVYLAHTGLCQAYGSVLEAKNRYGLPVKMDLTDKDFFEVIHPYLASCKSEAVQKTS